MSLVGCKNFIVDKPSQIKDSAIVLPAGILVFVNAATLNHKKRDGKKRKGEYCYWETRKLPKKFTEVLNLSESPRVAYDTEPIELLKEFAIYMAIDGKVRGYFIIHDLRDRGDCSWLCFYSDSFVEIKDGEILKPAQGWRYYPK